MSNDQSAMVNDQWSISNENKEGEKM